MSFDLEFASADIFGLSELSLRCLAGRPRPEVLGGELVVPVELSDIPDPLAVDGERFTPDERDELATRLELGLAPLEPHVAVLDAVRSLRTPGATAVIAGQQPGLFGGPLYNLYKAAHVVRLARDLSERWGRPVVPVLWNHGDDHDIAEVHHGHVVTPQLDVARVTLPGVSSGRTPLARLVLDDERHGLAALRERLSDLLAGEPYRDRAVATCFPRAGESIARAWTRLFLELFGHHGLVVLEPDWIRPNLSRALADLLVSDPYPDLARTRDELEARGIPAAIEPERAALVFRIEHDERHAMRHGGDGLQRDDEPGSRRASELAAEVVGDLEGYQAGALLRPLVQDLALPVAAYLGGWGELAYHAQLDGLRRARALPRPAFVPRLSCTLTDARVRTSLRRLGLELAAFLADPEASSEADGDAAPGPDLATRLRDLADDLRRRVQGYRSSVAELDHALVSQLKRAADQVHKHVDRFADKAERVATNQRGGARRHRRRLGAYLLPTGAPQERRLTIPQLLARFGTDWLDELVERCDALPAEHLLVHLATPAEGAPRR